MPTGIYKRTEYHNEINRKSHLGIKAGKENVGWKGNKVGYWGLHKWVERWRGHPDICEHCGKTGLKGHQIHWANKSREYKRDLTDWIRLCVKCHKKHDFNLPDLCECGKPHYAKKMCRQCYNKNYERK